MIGWSGFLRSWRVGRREALDQLAGDPDDDLGRPEAGHLLGLLERDRAVVDDRGDVGDRARLHVRQALALAPDAADRAVPGVVDLEDERLGELGADVERRAGGQRRRSPSRCQMRRQKAIRPRSVVEARPARSRRARRRARRGACPRPGPSRGGRRPGRRAPASRRVTRSPAAMPRATRSSRDGDEELRLVGVEGERDDARGRGRALRSLRRRLQRVDRVVRAGAARRAGRPARPPRRGRPARPASGSAAAAAGLEPALRLAQLVLERGDPVGDGVERLRPDRLGGRARGPRSARATSASAPSPVRASIRRMPEPMLRSPVITKPPIWPVARQWVPPHSSKL